MRYTNTRVDRCRTPEAAPTCFPSASSIPAWGGGPLGAPVGEILPDRGYNVEGTTDYRDRLNKVSVRFKPIEGADEAKHSIGLTYLDHLTHNVFRGNMAKWASHRA